MVENEPQDVSGLTLGEYVYTLLTELGICTVFTFAGDYISPLLNQINTSNAANETSPTITIITSVNAQEMAYAADGYSRATGKPGVVLTSFGIGSLSMANAVASSHVEFVPIIVINGAPARTAFNFQLLHGTFGNTPENRRLDRKVFAEIAMNSPDSQILTNPKNAATQLQNGISDCLTYRQPVYFEVPADVWNRSTTLTSILMPAARSDYPPSNSANVSTAVDIFAGLVDIYDIEVLIWAGEEIVRYGIQSQFMDFIISAYVPYMTNIHTKALVDEDNEYFVGYLDGRFTNGDGMEQLGPKKGIVSLGTVQSDLDYNGISSLLQLVPGLDFTMTLSGNTFTYQNYVDPSQNVTLTEVNLKNFITEYSTSTRIKKRPKKFLKGSLKIKSTKPPLPKTGPLPDSTVTYDNLVQSFDESDLFDESPVFCDTSLVMFPLVDNVSHTLSQGQWNVATNWSSMGYAVGGALGYKFGLIDTSRIANYPEPASSTPRMLSFIGDAGLQSCVTALSTMIQNSLNNIVVLVANGTSNYAQLRENKGPFAHETTDFPNYNVLPIWDYSYLAQSLGATAYVATDPFDLDDLIVSAVENTGSLCLIVCVVPPKNYPEVLEAYITGD